MRDFVKKINQLGKSRTPFLFIIDFEMVKPVIVKLNEIDNKKLLYNFRGVKNYKKDDLLSDNNDRIFIKKNPVSFEIYEKSFNYVHKNEYEGNSYLLNLTFPTEIKIDLSLLDVFYKSKALYKIIYDDQFVVFSPETFIEIKNQHIYSYPMKGTIDASIPGARDKILADDKELAEHITIVDLIRNDLNKVAKNSRVEKFRYIDEIKTNDKSLLQVSSKISAELDENYYKNLGSIIFEMLPAGSISGAPKKKTIEIIKTSELCSRGYYTGVCGCFDGINLDSAVMIRYIEKKDGKMFFRSGGGITIYSDLIKEYKEMVDKVYVPISRIN